VNGAVGAVTV
jgi:hypothetical protein